MEKYRKKLSIFTLKKIFLSVSMEKENNFPDLIFFDTFL